jgi:hypothetical protein
LFCFFQAAVRSSRRKRNQYVADLRDLVGDLKRRRVDGSTQNELLKQLTSLWERLCSEVENEIQDGVRQQLGFTLPTPKMEDCEPLRTSRPSKSARRTSPRGKQSNQSGAQNKNSQMQCTTIEEVMNQFLLVTNSDGSIQFDNPDRGAMEL